MSYVDGYVLPIPKKHMSRYRRMAVMGRKAWEVPEEKALSYVFGYANGNDFSARDLMRVTSQLMLGKTCDGFAPLGDGAG